jgi:N-acylneuraminate cytidylyltransferase
MVKKGLDDTFTLVNETTLSLSNRQSTPEVFDVSTVCYVANSDFILSNSGIFKGKVKAVKIPPERAIDIDTELDFHIAEALVKSGRVVL